MQMTFLPRRINVDAMSRRCIDVDATLSQSCLTAGYIVDVWVSIGQILDIH